MERWGKLQAVPLDRWRSVASNLALPSAMDYTTPCPAIRFPLSKRSSLLLRPEKCWMMPAREDLIDFLASNPTVGDVIAGTGGVRKVRWALPGRGKSGGARVIYYYHDERIPLYLLDAYAKNDQEDVSHAQRKAYRLVVLAATEALKERD